MPVNSLLEIMRGTPCEDANCVVHAFYNLLQMQWVIQHGDNEEAKFMIPDMVLSRTRDARPLVRDWLVRVHEWEDKKKPRADDGYPQLDLPVEEQDEQCPIVRTPRHSLW